MISIGVLFDEKRTPGINNLSELGQVPRLKLVPLDEALSTQWGEDALFVIYGLFNADGQQSQMTRINKPSLPQLQSKGFSVEAQMIALDYDSNENVDDDLLKALGWDGKSKGKPKVKWSAERLQEFGQGLKAAVSQQQHLYPSALYTTNHGARLLYLLPRRIAVTDIAEYTRGLISQWREAGLNIDAASAKWGQPFRLPFIARQGYGNTWEDENVRLLWCKPELTLNLQAVPRVQRASRAESEYTPVDCFGKEMPTAEEVKDMLRLREMNPQGHPTYRKMSAFAKKSKALLRSKSCYPFLFQQEPLLEGGRNEGLMKFVGEVIAVVARFDSAGPEHAFALFYEALGMLAPDDGTPDWFECCWNMILRIWSNERGKIEAEQSRRSEGVQDQLQLVLEKAKVWCQHEEIRQPDLEEARASFKEMLIACPWSTSAGCHILGPDGEYLPSETAQDDIRLTHAMQNAGWGDLLMQGQPDKLLARFSRLSMYTRKFYDCRVKGIVLRHGTEGQELVFPIHRRSQSYVPEFIPDIDQWLDAMLLPDEKEKLLKWIGYSLAVEDGPICALGLVGESGTGKNLLVEGLAQCFDAPWVSAKEAFGSYNDRIMDCPVVHFEEGIPKLPNENVADTFRQVVNGGVVAANKKYGGKSTCYIHPRIVVTANNPDVFVPLASNRDLTNQDESALSQRLLILQPRIQAKEWLEARGGREVTNRWINQGLMARHFLYLYESRHQLGEPDARFLVMGDDRHEMIENLKVQTEAGSDVMESACKIWNDYHANRLAAVLKGFTCYQGGQLMITSKAIHEVLSVQSRDVPVVRLGRSMSKMLEVVRTRATTLNGQQTPKQNWFILDFDVLSRYASAVGIPLTKKEANDARLV